MKKFEIGKEYSTRSICDHNCIFKFMIVKRTDKSVWIQDVKDPNSKIVRKKIEIYNDTEEFYPYGKYSMAPIIKA